MQNVFGYYSNQLYLRFICAFNNLYLNIYIKNIKKEEKEKSINTGLMHTQNNLAMIFLQIFSGINFARIAFHEDVITFVTFLSIICNSQDNERG